MAVQERFVYVSRPLDEDEWTSLVGIADLVAANVNLWISDKGETYGSEIEKEAAQTQ
jgi:hypothetical protein